MLRVDFKSIGAREIAIQGRYGRFSSGTGVEAEVWRRHLTVDEVSSLCAAVKKIVAKNLMLAPVAESHIGFDGARWFVEIMQESQDTAADEWSTKDGVLHDVGVLLLKLSGLVESRRSPFY